VDGGYKEGKYALNCPGSQRFVENQVRLRLFVLAYNLGNFGSGPALPEAIKYCSLTSTQSGLISTGGRFVRHASRLVFLPQEALVRTEVLIGIPERIWSLRPAPG